VTYSGVRAEILYQIDESWSALMRSPTRGSTRTSIRRRGRQFTRPAAAGSDGPTLQPSYDKDWFENSALTSRAVSSFEAALRGAYLVRNVEQVEDYTNYVRRGYVDYYQCIPRNRPRVASRKRDLARSGAKYASEP